MKAGERHFITWVESDKAEIVEDMLDERKVPIEMLPTPENIIEKEVFVCKDCFEVMIDVEMVKLLGELPFPQETRCFDSAGLMLWGKQ